MTLPILNKVAYWPYHLFFCLIVDVYKHAWQSFFLQKVNSVIKILSTDYKISPQNDCW